MKVRFTLVVVFLVAMIMGFPGSSALAGTVYTKTSRFHVDAVNTDQSDYIITVKSDGPATASLKVESSSTNKVVIIYSDSMDIYRIDDNAPVQKVWEQAGSYIKVTVQVRTVMNYRIEISSTNERRSFVKLKENTATTVVVQHNLESGGIVLPK